MRGPRCSSRDAVRITYCILRWWRDVGAITGAAPAAAAPPAAVVAAAHWPAAVVAPLSSLDLNQPTLHTQKQWGGRGPRCSSRDAVRITYCILRWCRDVGAITGSSTSAAAPAAAAPPAAVVAPLSSSDPAAAAPPAAVVAPLSSLDLNQPTLHAQKQWGGAICSSRGAATITCRILSWCRDVESLSWSSTSAAAPVAVAEHEKRAYGAGLSFAQQEQKQPLSWDSDLHQPI